MGPKKTHSKSSMPVGSTRGTEQKNFTPKKRNTKAKQCNITEQKQTILTPKQLELIIKLSEIPSQYSSVSELCKQMEVSRTTFYEWKKIKEFDEEWRRQQKMNYESYSSAVRSSLVKRAVSGDTKAIEIYLKHAEGWLDKQEINHTGTTPVLQFHVTSPEIIEKIKKIGKT